MKHLFSLAFLCLVGCSSVPTVINNPPEPDVKLQQAQQAGQNFSGTEVRWGGEVVKVDNEKEGSLLQIVEHPLNQYGKPVVSSDGAGRFLAYSKDFVDPYTYKPGTLVTVAGIISGTKSIQIGNTTLNVPIVSAGLLYRWPVVPYRSHPYDVWPGYPYYGRIGYGIGFPHWRFYGSYSHGFGW